MLKDNIPTAAEFIRGEIKYARLPVSSDLTEIFTDNDWYLHMKEFAKLHVKAALEAAAYTHSQIRISPVTFKDLHGYHSLSENVDIEKKIILNAYPETNIK